MTKALPYGLLSELWYAPNVVGNGVGLLEFVIPEIKASSELSTAIAIP